MDTRRKTKIDRARQEDARQSRICRPGAFQPWRSPAAPISTAARTAPRTGGADRRRRRSARSATRIDGGSRTGPLVGGALGAIAGATVGATLDRQHRELEAGLSGSGATVVNTGNQLVVTLPESITFDTDSAVVHADYVDEIAFVARSLREQPELDRPRRRPYRQRRGHRLQPGSVGARRRGRRHPHPERRRVGPGQTAGAATPSRSPATRPRAGAHRTAASRSSSRRPTAPDGPRFSARATLGCPPLQGGGRTVCRTRAGYTNGPLE